MDDYLQGPPADIVTAVKVGVTVECLVDGFGESSARATVRGFVGRLAVGDVVTDVAEAVELSEWSSDLGPAVSGTAWGYMTPDEWRDVAYSLCIDLPDGRVLPDSGVVGTLGMLDGEGITPAVAIEGVDEGWDAPVIASFYVAFLVDGEGADR